MHQVTYKFHLQKRVVKMYSLAVEHNSGISRFHLGLGAKGAFAPPLPKIVCPLEYQQLIKFLSQIIPLPHLIS